MTKTYTLTVFNTCTSQYEDIEVTKEVYNEFRRGEWRIEKNDDKHRVNETPFSELIGGDDGAFENFREFTDDQNTPEVTAIAKEELRSLKLAICMLEDDEKDLIESVYFLGMTMREYAMKVNRPLMTMQDKKVRILQRLKNILEKAE